MLASLVLMLAGLCVGSMGFEPVWRNLLSPDAQSLPALPGDADQLPADASMAWQIVWDIRVPRTLGAWLTGALLGLAGAVAQALFRNPLADPYLLGSAAGAALAVVLVLAALGTGAFAHGLVVQLGLTGAAFVGAVAAVLLTLALAGGVQQTLRLLLAGVVVGVVLGAMSSTVMSLFPEVLRSMQLFMFGSTSFLGWSGVVVMALVLPPMLVLAVGLAPVLDALGLGEATARSLGLPLDLARKLLIVVIALATGTAVAQAGLVAFVGLVSPHLVRGLWRRGQGRQPVQQQKGQAGSVHPSDEPAAHGLRSDQAWALLLATWMGGVLLLAADLLARSVLAPQELPVGTLTALVGGGYLLWLMHRRPL